MMHSLDWLARQLEEARNDPVEYFNHVKLRDMLAASHPDKWLSDEVRAKSIYAGFESAHAESLSPESIGDYRVTRKLARGDLSDVLLAVKDGNKYVIKRPRAKARPLIKQEAVATQEFTGNGNTYARLLPQYITTIDGDKNVFEFTDNLETLSSVSARNDKLSGRHIAWLFKRMLMAVGFSHILGFTHNAVTPDHVLVGKADHSILLVGWIHSGKPDGTIKTIPKTWSNLYPSWAKKTKKMSTSLDVALSAATCLHEMKDNAPRRLKNFLKGCLVYGTSPDAFNVYDEWDELLRDVYGEPRFVTLA